MESMEIAKTIQEQLFGTMDPSVIFSWGISGFAAVDNDTMEKLGIDNSLGGLLFNVNGHHHKGEVIVSLNHLDYYDVFICNISKENQTNAIKDMQKNLCFYEFGDWIDKQIEYIDEYKR